MMGDVVNVLHACAAAWPRRTPSLMPAKGFSLVELMVAMVLGILLIGGVVVTFLAGRAAAVDAAAVARVQENIRFASDYLVRDIRNAGFSDEGELGRQVARLIREQYAEVLHGGEALRIRYAGRAHCAEPFDEIRLIENEYSVNARGQLVCQGRSLENAPDAEFVDGGEVVLVGGVTRVAFETICPDGRDACVCDMHNNVGEACVGIRTVLEFAGLRGDRRSAVLEAALRNVILLRMNAGLPTAAGG